MSLQAYYDSLPPDQQALQFGLAGVDPLGHAFPRKRVVHAGLHGQLIAPAESQQIWQDIMSRPLQGATFKRLISTFLFAKQNACTAAFFKMERSRRRKTNTSAVSSMNWNWLPTAHACGMG